MGRPPDSGHYTRAELRRLVPLEARDLALHGVVPSRPLVAAALGYTLGGFADALAAAGLEWTAIKAEAMRHYRRGSSDFSSHRAA